MSSPNDFNADYYEHGKEKGISLYTNYHWMPERSLKEAHWLVQHMNIKPDDVIVDFGCAKGYLVKALTMLGYTAVGYDFSKYAIEARDKDVLVRLFDSLIQLEAALNSFKKTRRIVGVCKDVLEHSKDEDAVVENLRDMKSVAAEWLITVPLACEHCNRYVIPEYELDITHHIRLPREEWMQYVRRVFAAKSNAMQTITDSVDYLKGFKEHWAEKYPTAGGDLFIRIVNDATCIKSPRARKQ